MYVTADRRIKPRINYECQAIIEGDDTTGNKYSNQGRLKNLSAGGLYLLVDRNIAEGSRLNVTVQLADIFTDDSPRLATNGIVVRSEPQAEGLCGVAVRFHYYKFK